MADPVSILAQDTTISIDNSGGTPVAIGGVESIGEIGSGTATEIPTTTLASTAKEFRQGLKDNGSYTITFSRRNQDDLGQKELFDAMAAQATREFIITLPESTANVITHNGFVQNITTAINADGVVTGSATIRVTGEIVFS